MEWEGAKPEIAPARAVKLEGPDSKALTCCLVDQVASFTPCEMRQS